MANDSCARPDAETMDPLELAEAGRKPGYNLAPHSLAPRSHLANTGRANALPDMAMGRAYDAIMAMALWRDTPARSRRCRQALGPTLLPVGRRVRSRLGVSLLA